MKRHTLCYRELREQGCATYQTDSARLVFALRGICMVDVFDLETSLHSGYLDFDIKQDVMLGHAFDSPIIGLPFSNTFRKSFGPAMLPFQDLRSGHDVGFYIEGGYRNKGGKGIWNLDEIMMAVALETAYEQGVEVFTIRPTGDRAPYYRRKFNATVPPTTGGEVIITIDLKTVRERLQHITLVGSGGKTDDFEVMGGPDSV